jgi:hypothetical protein
LKLGIAIPGIYPTEHLDSPDELRSMLRPNGGDAEAVPGVPLQAVFDISKHASCPLVPERRGKMANDATRGMIEEK